MPEDLCIATWALSCWVAVADGYPEKRRYPSCKKGGTHRFADHFFLELGIPHRLLVLDGGERRRIRGQPRAFTVFESLHYGMSSFILDDSCLCVQVYGLDTAILTCYLKSLRIAGRAGNKQYTSLGSISSSALPYDRSCCPAKASPKVLFAIAGPYLVDLVNSRVSPYILFWAWVFPLCSPLASGLRGVGFEPKRYPGVSPVPHPLSVIHPCALACQTVGSALLCC